MVSWPSMDPRQSINSPASAPIKESKSSDMARLSDADISSAIGQVKNGVLAEYNTTTVGKAFEGTFRDSRWTQFETQKGAVIVEFNGTITFDALKRQHHGYLPKQFIGGKLRENCITSLGLADAIAQLNAQAEHEKELVRQQAKDDTNFVSARNREPWGSDLNQGPSAETQQQIDHIASKIDECLETTPTPVRVQFALSADKKTFKIGAIDTAFDGINFLYLIYH